MLPVSSKARNNQGFTLIELLVVIAILAVLLTIVLVAVNPAKNTQDSRNTKRQADVLTILNAVNQFYVANGSFPTGTPTATGSAVLISSATGGTGTAFCTDLSPSYVAALPADPTTGSFTSCSSYATGYEIQQTSGNRITISAPESLNDGSSALIQVTR